jgi:cold shock CspA family protein
MPVGNITRIVRDKGFGFIKSPDAKDDVFFHSTALSGLVFDDLEVGLNVEFSIEADPRNPSRSRAADVKAAN